MGISLAHNKHTESRAAHKQRRQLRGRKKIAGTAERPRLVVHRSAKHLFVQVVDDQVGRTLVSASTMEADLRATEATKSEKARKVGELLGERAKSAGIEQVVFDRAGYKYQGRVAALADGAREAGLQF